jgi:ketosteroid isomerase-like protein
MKRSIWVVAVLVLLAGYALASPMADDAAAVKGLEEKWAVAASKNDSAAVGSMLADSVTLIGSDGALRNKAEALAAMNDRKYESAVEEDLKVSVYGDAAVATGIWRAKGTEKGKPFEEVERFTDTYVKTGGQWKCVASHSSTMKAM